MASEPDAPPTRRERIPLRFQVEFRGRRVQGTGVVLNISESGALIGDADPLVVAGGLIRLRLAIFDGSVPVELPATVTRETPDGFAVRFRGLDARLKSLLGLAIAKARERAGEDDDEEKTSSSLVD